MANVADSAMFKTLLERMISLMIYVLIVIVCVRVGKGRPFFDRVGRKGRFLLVFGVVLKRNSKVVTQTEEQNGLYKNLKY